ncbi:MAG: hypothetical protein A3I05_01100 [Deltaproteobacteria bacterium RIFCSPLOWO2_02_FULL_44_10]|nr:MAG: hypothetical protein A3C46_02160 [Deltaproteobacteria bacterium RIFCSPHIGHO2_02_FULL_44_16]OGQ45840.1 MAG: hypothetical protein A3I05_01100 [Deltaproteobacteria bacterium RIFCSPLOWO2_02_FULL_44_10]
MHQRKQIRDKIVSLLMGKTDAGNNIFPSRVRPLEEQSLSSIQVYANSESSEIWQEAPREYERKLSLSIQITAKADEGLENTLDIIAEQVEDLLRQDHTLGELCRDVILTGTELTIHENGDTLIGSCNITYDILYYTLAVADRIPENGYNDLHEMDITWHGPQSPSGQEDARDVLDLR